MTDTQTLTTNPLAGLAFPVVRVRFAGPTDHRGSRYIATLRGVRHTESFDYALDGAENAYNAAVACWQKYRDQLPGEYFQPADYVPVFIPGDLDPNAYAFTVVPANFLEGLSDA